MSPLPIPAEIPSYLLLNSASVSDSTGYLNILDSLNPNCRPISAVLPCETPTTPIIPYKLVMCTLIFIILSLIYSCITRYDLKQNSDIYLVDHHPSHYQHFVIAYLAIQSTNYGSNPLHN